MLFDHDTLLSDGQAIVTNATSTNSYDAGGGARDLLVGEPLYLVAQVTEAFAAAGAATLTIALETSASASFTSPTVLYTTPPRSVAELTLGARPLTTRVPTGARRYLRLVYTVGAGPFTAGRVIAGLVLDGTLEDSNRGVYGHGLVGAA
jgi:hypothetical protein